MEKLIEALKGKKTYFLAVVGGVLLALQIAGIYTPPAELWGALGITGLATLRAGVSSSK